MKHFLLIISIVIAMCSCRSDRYVTIEGYAQGGTYHVIYRLPVGCSEKKVLDIVEGRLSAIDNSLSGYNKSSLLSRLNKGEDLPLDSLFIECFNLSRGVWEKSAGAFDPSAAPLFDLWGFGFEDVGAVSQEAIDSIMKFVGMDKVRLIKRGNEIFLEKDDPRIKLNFNAIAQGFTCDVIAAELCRLGCSDYLVEVGREIVCKGESSRGGKWRIGLDKPIDGNFAEGENLQTILEVTDCGIVTSGNYRKFYIRDGKKYAHTIDPRIGRPVEHHLLCATIITQDSSFPNGTPSANSTSFPDNSSFPNNSSFPDSTPSANSTTSTNNTSFPNSTAFPDSTLFPKKSSSGGFSPTDFPSENSSSVGPSSVGSSSVGSSSVGSIADAYATWAMVVGLEDAKSSIATLPGVTAYLVYDSDGTILSWDNL